MRVYTPQNIDIFKEEYHLNNQQEESLDEARDMMKYKPVKQHSSQQDNRRDLSRIYFYDHFNKWQKESIKGNKESYEHYRAIVDMGRSAVPFLYELAKEDYLMNDVLEEIYGCQFKKDDEYTEDINKMKKQFEELKTAWLKKIEEEGDI